MKASRIVTLISIAAAAVLAFAAPSSASAMEWYHTETGEAYSGPLAIDGDLLVNGYLGEVYCDVHADLTLSEGGQGEMTSLEPSNCVARGKQLEGCQVESAFSFAPYAPFPIHATEDHNILVEDFTYYVYLSGCASPDKHLQFQGDVTFTGPGEEGIDLLEVSQEVDFYDVFNGPKYGVYLSGDFQVEESMAGLVWIYG